MKAYLLFYNAACAAGWLFCVVRCVQIGLAGGNAEAVYKEIGQVLMISQTAMLLEIVHSLIGLVPSPVVTVAIQVSSRIFIVWGHLYWVPACQKHWSVFLMVMSWGITEVVRYSFYFCGLLGTVPYPLFWLRYSLFMVLYPTGITGELFQTLVGMYGHWYVHNPLWYRLSLLVLLSYVPGSPGMIGNMWANRKKALKKRNAAKAEEPEGVAWPKTKGGDRSSTSTNRAILAGAARAGPGGEKASEKVLKEKNWRFKYGKHLLDHVDQSLQSEKACLDMARAGLATAQETFQFIRKGHPEMSMKKAMETFASEAFETAEFKGSAPPLAKRELTINYGGGLGKPYYKFKAKRNEAISGIKLREQLDEWVQYGTMEPDVADALKTLQINQDKWLDLSGKYFVLLGAGSAMGPLKFILALGGNVVAIARSNALKSILAHAKNTPGKVLFPVRKGSDWKSLVAAGDLEGLAKISGCDLMTQTPEIATWVAKVAPGKQLTIGNYTYLDGALHVQIAVACDCIMERLCKTRKDTAVAFLGTPTDAHVVTQEAADAAVAAYKSAPLWMKLWESLGVLKQNKPFSAGGVRYMDAIVSDQGPNYILSKRLQHWRAMVARSEGHIASSNVSPSTATSSVTSNASFAAAYGGMHIFTPMEVIYQELSLSLMGALLLHDLLNPKSAANPANKIANPLCLFQATGFHGGIWRCPYTISTIGIPSAIKYYLTTLWLQILLGLAATATVVQYAAQGSLPGPLAAGVALLPWDMVSAPLRDVASALQVPF